MPTSDIHIDDLNDRAHGLNRLGNEKAAAGDLDAALEHYNSSLEMFRAAGNRMAESVPLGSIGNLYQALSDFPRALEYHRGCLEISRETGNRRGEAVALGNIGNVYYSLGEYASALEHYTASGEIFLEIGNRGGEAAARCNIGVIHFALGEYSSALENYQASLGINRERGDRQGEGQGLINIGGVHSLLGEHAQALEDFEYAHSIFHEIGDRIGEASALVNIGNTCIELKEFQRALEQFRTSLENCRQSGNRWYETESLIGIGNASLELGDPAGALEAHTAAAAVARAIGSRGGLGHALLGIGRTHLASDRPGDALDVLTETIAIAREIHEPKLELEGHLLISCQYERLGDIGCALEHLRRHIELKEQVLGDETRRRVHDLQTSSEIELARRGAEIERLRNVELKQALEELRAAQAQLVQSEKMASLGQLTAGIAHEINNPINFVSSSLGPLLRNRSHLDRVLNDLLQRLPEDERDRLRELEEIDETIEETGRLIESIAQGAGRTAEIVAGLRSFSRLDESGLKRVDIREGLDAAIAILSGSLSAGIELDRDYCELPDVECYPGEINQVFMNIVTNAIKAVDGAGTITIRTSAVDDRVTISIADSGVGMTPEVRARIFEPFFTTRDVGQGRGLGLSIAWGIVEKHGGSIEVRSAVGQGSEFVVTLPVG